MADWLWPWPLEGKLFDVPVYAGTRPGQTVDEALRRNMYEHGRYVRLRGPDEPWITPLMQLKCVDMRKTAPRPTDLFLSTHALLLSARAHEVLAPLAGPGVGFEPVEIEDGPDLFWVLPRQVSGALDMDRSRLTEMDGRVTHIARPVVHADRMPDGVGFAAFAEAGYQPALSAAVAEAIAAHDLYGIDLEPVEAV